MGFSVTSAWLVLFVALLGAGGVAGNAFWNTLSHVGESERVQASHYADITHTNLTVTGVPQYITGPQRYLFNLTNTGTTVLNMTEFEYMLDGQWTNDVEQTDVNGNTATAWLMPGETAEIRLSPVTSAPSALWVATEFGIATYYR